MTWRLRQSLCSAPGRAVRLVGNKQIKNWNNVFVGASLGPFDSWRFALAPPLTLRLLLGCGCERRAGDGGEERRRVDIVSHSFANLRATNGNNECIL